MYRYAEVEAALAQLHAGADEAIGAFKGRLIHFQRIGIAPASPGRGKKIEYAFEDVAVWAFCLQLAEFGIDPTRIAAIKTALWPAVAGYLRADREGEFFFAIMPSMLSRDMIEKIEEPASKNSGVLPLDGGESGFKVVFEAADLHLAGRSRALLINLTTLRRGLIAALASGPK